MNIEFAVRVGRGGFVLGCTAYAQLKEALIIYRKGAIGIGERVVSANALVQGTPLAGQVIPDIEPVALTEILGVQRHRLVAFNLPVVAQRCVKISVQLLGMTLAHQRNATGAQRGRAGFVGRVDRAVVGGALLLVERACHVQRLERRAVEIQLRQQEILLAQCPDAQVVILTRNGSKKALTGQRAMPIGCPRAVLTGPLDRQHPHFAHGKFIRRLRQIRRRHFQVKDQPQAAQQSRIVAQGP